MKLIPSIFVVAILVIFSASCATPKVVSGRYFDDRPVDSIVAGETTLDEILTWFGEPISTQEAAPDLLTLTYQYKLGPVPPKNSITEKLGEPELAGKTLVVATENSIVTHHRFSQNEAGWVGTVIREER